MSEKIGRNSPCTCGSGKKHKKCCLLKSSSTKSSSKVEKEVLLHKQFRDLEYDVFEKHLKPYLQEMLKVTGDCFSCAYESFLLDDMLNVPVGSGHQDLFYKSVFLPWMFFHWKPCQHFELVSDFNPSESIASNYLRLHANRLNLAEKRFMEDMFKTHFSFYRVDGVALNHALLLKDILLEKTQRVLSDGPTTCLEPGDVIFGRLLPFEGEHFLVSMTSFRLSPDTQEPVAFFREKLLKELGRQQLTSAVLTDNFELEVRKHLFNLMQDHFETQKCLTHNNDGHVFIETSLFCKLDLPIEQVLSRLSPLIGSQMQEKTLQNAKIGISREATEIKVKWLSEESENHTEETENVDKNVLGEITLKNDLLILETNSEERAAKGLQFLKKLLGSAIVETRKTKKAPRFIGDILNDEESIQTLWEGLLNLKKQAELEYDLD